MPEAVELTVRAAERTDAGRGIGKVSEVTRRRTGALSGDTVVVEGTTLTAVTLWTGSDVGDDEIRIDADARSNAGVGIGDTVRVHQRGAGDDRSIRPAESVRLAPPPELSGVDTSLVARAVEQDLADRPVNEGEQLRIEKIGDEPFRVVDTAPEGPVRITDTTDVAVDAAYESETDGERSEGRTGVTYEDIGGLDEQLELVRETVELPLSQPDLFRPLGVDPPRGVLLYGPPGTGKTLIAKAVANEVDAHFQTISGPEIVSKYKGESEKQLRERFERARENAPAIVFFDEIDSIAGERDEDSDAENRIVAQLLSLMDGLDELDDVVVIGATNRVDAIDPALRRGGRFDREVQIGVPDADGRREILDVHTRGMPLADDVGLDRLAERTHGFVGADLESLTGEAAMATIRRRPADLDGWDPNVTRADFESAMAAVEPSGMREFVAETSHTTFDDVGGLAEAKRTLTEAVEWPLSYARLFEMTETDPPSGILLYGPPGTGKTLLGRALAGESEVNFVHVAGPELLDRYVGESEKAVRKLFDRARQSAPSIVFFDEIDAIARQRGDNNEVGERVVSQLLTELDGLSDNPNVVVLAATNRRDTLDEALLRPGRFDAQVEVPRPDTEARRAIFSVHADGKPLGDDVDLDALAADLTGYTGADVEAVVREASMRAIREMAAEYGPEEANERAEEIVIDADHVAAAVESVDPTG